MGLRSSGETERENGQRGVKNNENFPYWSTIFIEIFINNFQLK